MIRLAVLAAFGGGAGLGLWLFVRGLIPRAVPLGPAFDRFHETGPMSFVAQEAEQTDDPLVRLAHRLGPASARILESLGFDFRSTAADLRATGSTRPEFAFRKLGGAVVGAVLPLVLWVFFTAAGMGPSPIWAVIGAVFGVAIGFLLPSQRLVQAAEVRREDFQRALAAYLDLTRILVAGGSHIDGALYSAALAGEGWAFAQLLSSVDWARTTGSPVFVAFDRLGHDLGIPDLNELAASIALADEQGAPPNEALARKAEMMAAHERYRTRAAAESATEKMAAPTVVLALAFALWLAIPAAAQLMDLSGTGL